MKWPLHMTISQQLQDAGKKFKAGQFDDVLTICQQQLSNDSEEGFLWARLAASCYIKQGKIEELTKLLQQQEKCIDKLEFERAYAEFKTGKDASWFLNSASIHPQAQLLRAQIAYKLQRTRASSYFAQHIKPNTVKGATMVYAASAAGPIGQVDVKLRENNDYDLQYNKAIYLLSRAKRDEAKKTIESLKSRPENKENEQWLRLSAGISSKDQELNGDVKIVNSVHNILGTIQLKQMSLQNMLDLQKQTQESIQRIFQVAGAIQNKFGRRQIDIITHAFHQLNNQQSKYQDGVKLPDAPQTISLFAAAAIACAGALPDAVYARRFKRIPERLANNQVWRMRRVVLGANGASQEALTIARSVAASVGCATAAASLGGQKEAIALCKFHIPSDKAVNYAQASFERQANAAKQSKEMPKRWQKKPRAKTTKPHHQGVVAEKAEVTKVAPQQQQFRGGHPSRGGGRGGKGGRGRR